MNTTDVLNTMVLYAKVYRKKAMESVKRNKHMNDSTGNDVNQKDVDAILVDFINFIGSQKCIDYGLYTKDIVQVNVLTELPQTNED